MAFPSKARDFGWAKDSIACFIGMSRLEVSLPVDADPDKLDVQSIGRCRRFRSHCDRLEATQWGDATLWPVAQMHRSGGRHVGMVYRRSYRSWLRSEMVEAAQDVGEQLLGDGDLDRLDDDVTTLAQEFCAALREIFMQRRLQPTPSLARKRQLLLIVPWTASANGITTSRKYRALARRMAFHWFMLKGRTWFVAAGLVGATMFPLWTVLRAFQSDALALQDFFGLDGIAGKGQGTKTGIDPPHRSIEGIIRLRGSSGGDFRRRSVC